MSAPSALLLIGHGSARYPQAPAAMRQHANAIRASGAFAEIEIAVLNGAPSVAEAISRIRAPVVRVVPFFMEDGYFSRIAVPRAIREAASHSGHIQFCPPVGTHDGIAGILEHQALTACASIGAPSRAVSVVIVGHGSARAPGRLLALHRHAARVASTTLFARVEPACLEEPPFVADTLASLRAHPVVVIGFFANHGGHVRDDLPALIAAEQAARGSPGLVVRFHGSVTDDPAMVAIILDQARTNSRGE